jgi:hypothetical protein
MKSCEADEIINDFLTYSRKDNAYKEYLKQLTFEKLYLKDREIEDNEQQHKFIILCDFFEFFFCVVVLFISLVNYNLLFIINT